MKKIGINGFGRIGRVFFRAALADEEFMKKFQIVVINGFTNLPNLAHLVKYDSVFGALKRDIKQVDNSLFIDGNEIKLMNKRDPSEIPWKELGVEYVLESTGKFRDRESASRHLTSGARKVLLSASGKKPDATIVLGVNEKSYDPKKHHIISMASCTTNCLAPLVKVLDEAFGIKQGYMTTCHAVTNDQGILDFNHKDPRRSRSAMLSIIPTTTGAATAVGVVLPQMQGKIDGIALRVPVVDGSIVDLVVELRSEATAEEINQVLKEASLGKLKGIMEYTDEPIVSVDIIGNPHSCIVDGRSTMVMGDKGNFVKILAWYDNEWGYSARLVDTFKLMLDKES